ncbi:hypothetical protein ABZZ36_13630 [Actinacidiphila glaucinigra]|uniref:hypothetical protein n=1 Tax=Actinacidiphila glaucinigra TaxID=235986 RepID=UPI0033AFBFDD
MTIVSPVEQLLRICPPGASPQVVEWELLESQLGYALPGDYKELAARYPLGSFDSFLGLWQPMSTLLTADLRNQIGRALVNLRSMRRAGGELPAAEEMLVPVGGSDNGDRIYWVREPAASPDTWPLAINEPRGYRWHQYDGGIAAFLVAVLTREISVPFFPKSFPSPTPKFREAKLRPRRQRMSGS